MTLALNIPALLFPAISLTMLAYNARYLAIASLIRNLHEEYQSSHQKDVAIEIRVLSRRLYLIIATQGLAILSFIGCIITMFFIYLEMNNTANTLFIVSLLSMTSSLVILFIEILVSMNALKIRLGNLK
ncbi:DUF2721 domain-containing protein [Wenyingzhuangia sp. IMCC45533]